MKNDSSRLEYDVQLRRSYNPYFIECKLCTNGVASENRASYKVSLSILLHRGR